MVRRCGRGWEWQKWGVKAGPCSLPDITGCSLSPTYKPVVISGFSTDVFALDSQWKCCVVQPPTDELYPGSLTQSNVFSSNGGHMVLAKWRTLPFHRLATVIYPFPPFPLTPLDASSLVLTARMLAASSETRPRCLSSVLHY